jgi:mannose-6-phosphate isomerase-like protein (cupin superfamily)
MNHHKLISWPPIPTAEILDIIKISDPELAKVQNLDKATQEMIIKLLDIGISQNSHYKIMLVYMPPHKKLWIHSDKPKETTDPGKSEKAVFLPLTSCEKLHWSWFECTDTSQIFYHGEKSMWQQVIPMLPYSAAKEIETVPANKTMITDIGTWHALRNESDTPEIALSIRVLPWSWEEFSSISIPLPITFK